VRPIYIACVLISVWPSFASAQCFSNGNQYNVGESAIIDGCYWVCQVGADGQDGWVKSNPDCIPSSQSPK
jgi:hypothetical protein